MARRKRYSDVPEPINITDKYLHGMVVRLDALCAMMDSVIQYIADKDGVAVENNKVIVKQPAKRTSRKVIKDDSNKANREDEKATKG